jgi:putative heme-binding domain-containing protein
MQARYWIALAVVLALFGLLAAAFSTASEMSAAGIVATRGSEVAEPTTVSERQQSAIVGDLSLGRKLFYERLSCLDCHSVSGQGEHVGPDLADIGNLLTSIQIAQKLRDPAKVIAPGYQKLRITLSDGRQIVGTLEPAGERIVVVRNDGYSATIPSSAIDETVELPSEMPEDVVAGLSPEEFAGLVAFLSQLRETTGD